MLMPAIATGNHTASFTPPLDDPVYQTLLACRAPDVIALRLAKVWPKDVAPKHARVIQTHYKPYSRARLLVELSAERKQPWLGQRLLYLGLFADAERARKRYASALTKPARASFGPPATLLEDWGAVAWSLPNGPRLGSIDLCMDAVAFQRLLAEHGLADGVSRLPRLLRYVARQRALFRHESRGRTLYLKFYRKGAADKAAHNLGLLAGAAARGGLGFQPPFLAFHSPRARTVGMREVPGVPLTDANATPSLFSQVGYALAGLHRSAIQPAARWAPEAEVLALRRAMRDIQAALPAAARWLDPMLDEIEYQRHQLVFDTDVPIHGNLFGDQILVAQDQIGIVDWDDLCTGDPLFDLGRLIAHTIYGSRLGQVHLRTARCVDALLRGYAEALGRKPDLHRLRWHIAMALLMRAKISALRPLAEAWIEDIWFAITQARGMLQHTSEWMP